MKQQRRIIFSVILVAALIAAVWGWRARVRPRPVQQIGRTVTVKVGDITVKVAENGTLEPVTQVDVKSRVGGRVQRIFVKEGDRVTAGQTLAVVDPTEVARQVAGIEAQLASARAGLSQAEENYALSKTQNRLSIDRSEAALEEARRRLAQIAAPTRRQDVAQQQTSIARSDAQVLDARRNLDRRKALVAKGFIAQAEADSAQTALLVAEADARGARERISLLKEGTRPEDIAVARASIRSAEVQLATDRANAAQAQLRLRDVERARGEVAQIESQLAQQAVQLRETRIIAPISGEVVGKYLEEGELVASATAGFAQGAAIVRVADLNRMQVRVNINEVDVARIRTGMPVEINVDGVPNKTFSGRVAAIAPSSLTENQTSSATQTTSSQGGVVRFEVKVAVVSRDGRLRPGMTAAVGIILNRHAKVLLLPAEALQVGNKVALVTGTGDAATKATRTLTIGLKNDAQVEVLSGLQKGDRVEVPKISAPDRRKINVSGPN
ncbi:MAG: efflux RND transporter periplasmic adaptor subunit [Cytophagales bacterium]|nr:efflux RND transporter periplasmic adaptor subunit [Armatimonadota bacterium]